MGFRAAGARQGKRRRSHDFADLAIRSCHGDMLRAAGAAGTADWAAGRYEIMVAR